MRHTLVLLALGALPLGAQTGSDVKQRAAAAVALPITTADLRGAGVTDRAIVQMVEVLQRDRVGQAGIGEVLELEREALRTGGRPENFGAFVQQARSQGLRGQALAAAIHAERARRGGNVGVGGPPAGVGRGGPPAGVGRGGDDNEARGGPPAGVGRGGPPAGVGRGGDANEARGGPPAGGGRGGPPTGRGGRGG
jgi:hypothetical protein